MKSLIYGLPFYLYTILSLFAIWYSYIYNQKMIENEDYSYMVEPWKPMLIGWAIITGLCAIRVWVGQ